MDLTAMFEPTAEPAEVVGDLLHDVIDPEVGLNIMDLGLVRDIKVDDGSGFVYITMTLTTPSCPLGPYIEDDINRTLGQVAWVTGVDVRLVWDPLWDPMRDMTDAGKDAMGWN
jgi:metal-sulfur cluster biosynthetic enzyme